MAHFDKNSIEYLENGHYKIGGVEFMSIWTFKNRDLLTPNEYNINGTESKNLESNGVENHTCAPDIRNIDKVSIYPIEELEEYYMNY